MASRKASDLQTSTNTGGKRKVEDGAAENLTMKKLKSHNRTMTTVDAKRVVAESEIELKIQNKIIRNQKKEIRELKKDLKAAEKCLAKAERRKERIERQNAEALPMVKEDSELIFQKVKDASTSFYLATERLSCDAMDDMIALGDEAGVFRLAECIRDLGKESTLQGAIKALLLVVQHQQQPSSACAMALRQLYLPFVQGTVKSDDTKIWPLIASAVTISISEIWDDSDKLKENRLLSTAVLEAVKRIKEKKPSYGKYYNADADNCPIIDLLLPTYNAIKRESGRAAKSDLLKAIKMALLQSTKEGPSAPPNYTMPTEAAIAAKKGHPELQRFLLSPVAETLRMDISRRGRSAVHQCINYEIRSNYLSLSSEGFGIDKVLVIQKTNVEPVEMIRKREERKTKHGEMLATLFCSTIHITLPRSPETKLGLAMACNPSLGMPELKGVSPNSPIRSQIPEKFHKDCCIVLLKSVAIGRAWPRSAQECASMIAKSREGGSNAPMNDGKLEIAFLPVNELIHK